MQQVTATQAKAHLAELLRRVERGETVAITRHGETVAHMVPAVAADPAGRKQAVDRFRRSRGAWKPAGMSTEEILDARHLGHRL